MFILLGLLLLPPVLAQAQEESADPILSGRLLLGGLAPDSGTVTLHRVTPEEAGEIASVAVDAEGGFEIELPHAPVPGSGEIFFASTRYEGILYFGGPITAPEHLAEEYRIEAYRSRPSPETGVPLPVEIRNVFIREGPMGWEVTDVFELRNDSTVTFVPPDDGGAVWRYPLPPGARTFRLAQGGDLPDGAITFENGVVTVSNPIPPGRRLFVFQYEVDALDFDLPLPGVTERIELLLEEPAPPVQIQGLARQGESIEMEAGSSYIRWTGMDLRDQTARVAPAAEDRAGELVVWFAVALAFLLIVFGTWVLRRESPGVPKPPSASPRTRTRKAILVDVARLDEEYEAAGRADAEAAADYRRRRAALIDELERIEEGSEPASRP